MVCKKTDGPLSEQVVVARLSALSLPAVYVINRYPASIWYGGLHWSAWHIWPRARGVSVSAFHLGTALANGKRRWMPFLSSGVTAIPAAPAAAALAIAASAAEPVVSVVGPRKPVPVDEDH